MNCHLLAIVITALSVLLMFDSCVVVLFFHGNLIIIVACDFVCLMSKNEG